MLSIACCNIENFRNFIISNKNISRAAQYLCYAMTVIDYATAGVNNVFYTSRAHILSTIFKAENGIINCEENVGTVFANLMQYYDCTKNVLFCKEYRFNKEEKKYLLPLPKLNIVWEHEFKNFEEALNNYITKKCRHCSTCNKNSVSSKYYYSGPYIL